MELDVSIMMQLDVDIIRSNEVMNNISITTDLSLFADKSEYDKLLARLNLDNFGKIYYYIDTVEPLEVEDVIDVIMDQD